MQTIGEYALAIVTFAASVAIAAGLAAIFGGPWVQYLVGMVAFRVCLWEVAGLRAADRAERQQ